MRSLGHIGATSSQHGNLGAFAFPVETPSVMSAHQGSVLVDGTQGQLRQLVRTSIIQTKLAREQA